MTELFAEAVQEVFSPAWFRLEGWKMIQHVQLKPSAQLLAPTRDVPEHANYFLSAARLQVLETVLLVRGEGH